MRSIHFCIYAGFALALGCSSGPEGDGGSGGTAATGGVGATGATAALTGGVGAIATGGAGATVVTGGSATGGVLPTTGGLPATGGLPPNTGGLPTGGASPSTGGIATGGLPPSTGGLPTGGLPPVTGGAATGGTPTGGAGTGGASTGGVPTGGVPTGGADPGTGGQATGGSDPGTGGAGGAGSDCPYSGNITYTLNRADNPTADELDAYEHLIAAMDEALYYYNCYADLEKQLWVNYNTSVPTAEANIDGWMSFGSNRAYMVVATAMHEVAHTLGVGYYGFADMTDSNGIWMGENANAILASIPSPRDTQLHADSMHFWPYGLNYASEYENEDDLINHVRIVAAIRLDLGVD